MKQKTSSAFLLSALKVAGGEKLTTSVKIVSQAYSEIYLENN